MVDWPFRALNCLVSSLSATASKIHPPTIASGSLLIVGAKQHRYWPEIIINWHWWMDPCTSAIFRNSGTRPSRKMFSFALSLTNNQISIFNGEIHCCRTDLNDARTMSSMPKIFIHQLHNFDIAKMNSLSCVYWNFCANLIIFLEDIKENKSVFFIATPCVSKFSYFLIKTQFGCEITQQSNPEQQIA